MNKFPQYSIVRVVKLVRSGDDYDDWQINQRSPQIGDVGMIVEILHHPQLPDCFVVESTAKDGKTIWLSDFSADELELILENASGQVTHS